MACTISESRQHTTTLVHLLCPLEFQVIYYYYIATSLDLVQQLGFLGMEVSSVAMEFRLPRRKLE